MALTNTSHVGNSTYKVLSELTFDVIIVNLYPLHWDDPPEYVPVAEYIH